GLLPQLVLPGRRIRPDLALVAGERPGQQQDHHCEDEEGDERSDPGTGVLRVDAGEQGRQGGVHRRIPWNRSSSGVSTCTRERASSNSSTGQAAFSMSRGTAKKKPSGSIWVACASRARSRRSK